MERDLEQMLQTICGKGIAEASKEEIYEALLQLSKEKMQGMKHNEGNRKLYYISVCLNVLKTQQFILGQQ